MLNKHTKDGTHTVDTVSTNDNLIIKGNNQIVLENLLSVYKGISKAVGRQGGGSFVRLDVEDIDKIK